MTDNVVSILVVSDLHAVINTDHRSDSFMIFENGKTEFGDDFISFIDSLDTSIDVLVCPGDISNRADDEAFQVGWDFLNRVQKELKISTLLCVPGNHDHKSRNKDDLSPKHSLQFVSPSFPSSDYHRNTHFWAWNWLHTENESFNSILLNSSAYHGYKEGEMEQGRVAPETCQRIGEYVKKSFEDKSFNLLLCHHAPYKMEHAHPGDDNQEIQGAQNLIHILESSNDNPWLVIHGHKHFAEIRYAISKTNAPTTLLSAGSLSSKSTSENLSNQFHILRIDLDQCAIAGRVVGTFNSYEWKVGFGWAESGSNQLPAYGGFGSNIAIPQVASAIEVLINNQSAGFVEESELSAVNESIKYCTPDDIKSLVSKLDKKGISVDMAHNKIIEAGVKNDYT